MSDDVNINKQPLVTVALSVLNGGSPLELSVRSVLSQSWPHWELLILDDGSTDGAIDRLHCLSDPRIIVVRDGRNCGLAARLNQAVSMAKGKYFARMDHDDLCHSERFAKQVRFLENNPEVDVLATQCITMDEQERLKGILPSALDHADICRRPWQGFYMAHPTWMGRIEWFRRNTYLDPAPYCCEDQELLLRAYRSSCYNTLPERLLAYRVRTHTHWKKLCRTHVAMLKMQFQYFLGRGEWTNALLSGFVEFARIGRDSWGELRHRLAPPAKIRERVMPSPDECHEWEALIKVIKAPIREVGSNGAHDGKPEYNKVGSAGMPTVMFVATTPFAVNAFLANHIAVLSEHYKITLCTNFDAYELLPSLLNRVEVRQIPFARKISLGSDLKSLLQLTAAVRQVRPAVIHSITPKAGLLAMIAGFMARVPHRWHTFTGQVWATRKGLARRLLKALDRLIALMASRVFADSASQCRLLRDEGVVRNGQIGMLGSGSIAGVDPKRFCPDTVNRERLRKQMGANANACVFLFVGRLARDKGVFDLVQAFRELATSVHDIELWVVGPDEEGLLQALQESAEGCDAPIRWLGATPTPEHFMAAADVLLLPSYREGFGSVIIEGAACGIPAIAYRIDGVIDAIVDESSGLLVKVGQPKAFASAMKLLALDRELRLRLGHQAQERAVRDFSSERVTQAWLEFYRSQLNKKDEAIC